MNSATISTQYEQLPDYYKQEANDFIEFLFSKAFQSQGIIEKKPLKRNGLGSLKGLIKMAEDFDEPLEEFKDYM
jgi:hypothetical protein